MSPENWPTYAAAGFCAGMMLAFIWFVVAAVRDICGPDDERREP